MSKATDPDAITPYQARLYNAVLFGYDQARVKVRTPARRAVEALWLSRRRVQAENARLREKLGNVEALCASAQVDADDPAACVRADHLNYVINAGTCPEPEGFPPVWRRACNYLERTPEWLE